MEENILTVTMDTGEEVTINVLDIFKDKETQNEYIIYNFIDDDDIYASKLIENETTVLLQTIEDENEQKLINSYITTSIDQND